MQRKIISLVVGLLMFFPLIVFATLNENPLYHYQWYLNAIRFTDFTTSFKRGEGVVVAVIDSGVWLQHPDLAGAAWKNSGETEGNGLDDDNNGYIDDIYGWNFIDNNADLQSKSDHGTAVAGVIAAQDNITGTVGIAPNVKIMSLTACSSSGCGTSSINKSIIYAVNNGARVINLSLGSRGYLGYNHDFDSALKYAHQNGVFIVASAGNGDVESGSSIGQDLSFLKASPINNDVDGINTVWGVGATIENGNATSWSNYGNGVDSWAPGKDIVTLTVPIYSDGYLYKNFNGTSFSAPMVAAATALLISNYPTISMKQIQDRLSTKRVLDIQDIFTGQHQAIYSNIPNCVSHSSLKNNLCVCDSGYEFNSDRTICLQQDVSAVPVAPTINVLPEQSLVDSSLAVIDIKLTNQLKGRILLQTESHGEAWYVNPRNGQRYYLANGESAYAAMRLLGVGILNKDYSKLINSPAFALKNKGKIFLRIEAKGEAYYVDFKGMPHYLKDGAAAYQIMRELGLGITNSNLNKIAKGSL